MKLYIRVARLNLVPNPHYNSSVNINTYVGLLLAPLNSMDFHPSSIMFFFNNDALSLSDNLGGKYNSQLERRNQATIITFILVTLYTCP